jgi:hypothetical protein
VANEALLRGMTKKGDDRFGTRCEGIKALKSGGLPRTETLEEREWRSKKCGSTSPIG